MASLFRFRHIAAATISIAALPLIMRAAEVPKAPAKPVISLPLEDFGYRPSANSVALRAGFTAATVNFIDKDHVLLTYSARKLMKRLTEQRESDDDHIIRALVVHLPDGKVLRETEWRMHDRAVYLWPLAKGLFLLRERGNLYSLDPMSKTDPEHFGQHMLVRSEDDLEALEFSPTRDLMLMERSAGARIGDDPTEKRDKTVFADFYRVNYLEDGVVTLTGRGHARSRDAFSMAFTSRGLLQAVKEDRAHWGFDFKPYGGKNMELAGFTSTCRPHSVFISDAEFFAFGCRGGDDRRLMGGFNLLAEAQWVFTTDDPPLWLAVESAPGTGRFAIRNTLTNISGLDNDQVSHADVRQQEVRVYEEREGNEVLRVTASPAQRTGGNFSLSPDGLRLAVLHDTNLEVYTLPAIPEVDRKLQEREAKVVSSLKDAEERDVAKALAADTAESSDQP